ncbi:hypothetical protein PVK06_029867 [Gossypium arboreum]|uniref:Uncharacterized protein n=1 Tax=Gossypium arboreum TaxID=29729 RepID=A0ABR0NMQ1_GOSAR|nr:hypothetical protein PVK06_029867 [Gossypium arboreum]
MEGWCNCEIYFFAIILVYEKALNCEFCSVCLNSVSGGFIVACLMGQSLSFISFLKKSKFKVATASKIIIKLTQANPATNSASSSSTNVLTHPYGTRQKMKALIELFGQTSSMLNDNLLYDSSSPTYELVEVSHHGSSVARRLSFKGI